MCCRLAGEVTCLCLSCPHNLGRQCSRSTDNCCRNWARSLSFKPRPNTCSASRNPFNWPIMVTVQWHAHGCRGYICAPSCATFFPASALSAPTAPPCARLPRCSCPWSRSPLALADPTVRASCNWPVGFSVTLWRPVRSILDPVTSRMNSS